MEETLTVQEALQQILQDLVNTAAGYVPRVITAAVVLIVGLLIAKVLEIVLRTVLTRVKFDALLQRVGVLGTLQGIGVRQSPSRSLPRMVFILFVLVFVETAARHIGLLAVADAVQSIFAFLPNLIAAALIVLLGNSLSQFIGNAISHAAKDSGVGYAKALGRMVSGLILIVVLVMGLAQLRVDTELLNLVTIVLIGGFALGFALTFGLGTRDTTRNIIAGFYARKLFRVGREMEVGGQSGTLKAITSVQTLLDRDGRTIAVPNSRFLDEAALEKPEAND